VLGESTQHMNEGEEVSLPAAQGLLEERAYDEKSALLKYFRPAKKGEGEFVSTSEILQELEDFEPELELNIRQLGRVLKEEGFQKTTIRRKHKPIKGYWVLEV